jgi:hypothetical protein
VPLSASKVEYFDERDDRNEVKEKVAFKISEDDKL